MRLLKAFPLAVLMLFSGQILAQQNTQTPSIPSTTRDSVTPPGMTSHPEGVLFESWTFYFDQLERNASTVYFDKGSALIPPVEKDRITDWVTTMKLNHPLRNVVIASWSDQPYPAKGVGNLTKSDKDLAAQRNTNIRDLLKAAGVGSVETFSMAERPNWFQRTFGTDAAQIKGEAKDKHWDSSNEARLSAILKRRGGPSKAVIILRPYSNDANLTGGR